MTFIPDWRKAHKFLSLQAAVLLAVLSVLQAQVLPLIQFAVPPQYWPYVSAAFGIAIVLLRLLNQPALDEPPTQAPSP